MQQIKLCPSKKPKKACIRPCDTNNSTQSITRMYHHTASLYRQRSAKVSWTPTLAGVSYQFGFIHVFIVCNARSLDHQFFLFFLCKVSHPKVRIVMDPSFWKKLQIGLACPKVRFLEFWKKSYSFRYTSSLQYRSAKKKYFFWRFTKTACLQKMWFLS